MLSSLQMLAGQDMQETQEMAADRRSASRRRTLLGGTVRYNARKSSLSCRIRNMSATGALLEITGASWLPDQFELDIPHHDIRAPVRAVWRDNDRMGVLFVPQSKPAAQSLSEVGKLSRLQAEREMLKARVRDLSNEY